MVTHRTTDREILSFSLEGAGGLKTCVSACLPAAAKSAITFDHFDISAQFFWVKLTPSK